ncbi:MAG: alpha/beta fold hydrolase [Deltaproteobacteria bacterium]|nr:alpha/beta fold hydrolase [Deltaproteobacteria bacterium]
MGKVAFNGVSINYRCFGQGRDVVLIHGLAANQGFWSPSLLLPLARKFRVTLLDLRGHGYSEMPPTGYTSADMAEDLLLLLNHLEIPKAHLVGHSFGGVVALHCAALYPERVFSLTIADTRVRTLQPNQCSKDWPNWSEAKKNLESHGLLIPENETEAGLWLLENMALLGWGKAREKIEGRPVIFPFSKWNGINRSAKRWLELLETTTARQDFLSPDGLTRDRLSTIKKPVLTIYGENSPVIPSLRGLEEHLYNCRTAIIPEAGHFFPATHTEIFLNTVTQFLKEVGPEERRKYERFILRLSGEVRGMGISPFPVTTVNVSSRGLLLESYKKLEIVSDVEFLVTLNSVSPCITLTANLVRFDNSKTENHYQFSVELHGGNASQHAWENFLAVK